MNNFRCVDKGNDGIFNGRITMPGMECPVIFECPVERVCHREIHHHVPQDCPLM